MLNIWRQGVVIDSLAGNILPITVFNTFGWILMSMSSWCNYLDRSTDREISIRPTADNINLSTHTARASDSHSLCVPRLVFSYTHTPTLTHTHTDIRT